MKEIALNIFLFTLLISCGGGSEDTDSIPTPSNPDAVVLIFPEENSECTVGTEKSETSSSINFKWNKSSNTDSYELVLKNLNTDQLTNHTSDTNQLSVELKKGNPYSWYVISKSLLVTNTATSEIWKFYNAAEGIVSYAPFPAEVVSPSNRATLTATDGKITLDWNASDVDGDITSYDVYFGTNQTASLFQSGVSESTLSNILVNSDTSYYWYIITNDSKGNSSTSDVFEFSIN